MEKKRVYQELVVMQKERNRSKFGVMLQSFLNSISGDLLEYFSHYYCTRTKMWAVCFRHPQCPDTNAHAESFHRVLKHVALGGKRNRKVRALIEALLRMEQQYFLQTKT